MTLHEEIRKMAEEVSQGMRTGPNHLNTRDIESAIHSAIKLVLEREPSAEIVVAMHREYERMYGMASNALMLRIYHAMTAQLLKELNESKNTN